MQELNKGTPLAERMPDAWANSEGGWGFNLAAYNRKYINRKTGTMTNAMKKRILTMTDDELKANPVFKPFDESWLHSTNSVVSIQQINTVRARILGDGIPATSFAAGANQLDNRAGIVQRDYHLYAAVDWPRAPQNENVQWRHSDIKKVAFRYLHNFAPSSHGGGIVYYLNTTHNDRNLEWDRQNNHCPNPGVIGNPRP
jgi:hypothetical protein